MKEEYKSKPVMFTFITTGNSLRKVGGAFGFIYKGKDYCVPQSQCIADLENKTIKIPEWLCKSKGLL